jgi:phosphatidylserine decarboxylase
MEKDGYPFVIGAFATALVCLAGRFLLDANWPLIPAGIFFVLGVFFMYFFRSPERVSNADSNAVISPADGTALYVTRLESYPGFDTPVWKIAIFLSVFNVHVNWTPIDGKVKFSNYFPGKFHAAFVDKASEENERTEIGIESPNGMVVFKQIAGLLARRIVCRLKGEQVVERGEKFGMIKFSSRVEVFVPESAEVCVKPKDKIKGGLTVLANLAPVPETDGPA